jgi:hypothetical protein
MISQVRRPLARRLLAQRRPWRQRVFSFVDRARRRDRGFKLSIALFTLVLTAIVLSASVSGRYLTSWAITRGKWLAIRAVGLRPGRDQIDADWRRKRLFDIEQSRSTLAATFAEYGPDSQKLLTFAGLDPGHALVRWGNFDRTVLLPSTIFEPDDHGRSYRFRPNLRSIWVRNFSIKGPLKAYFQVPDLPEAPALVSRTGASIVEGSAQTTNSWGLRGPEPDPSATWRGIVLGDSYMQGLFVGDQETPTECLKRDLKARLHATVEVLNTGHLGYSTEQYYYTLLEYASRFPPQFVVVSIFANDFGSLEDVLSGKGDWEEGSYWLNRIREFCGSLDARCLVVPAPWVNQVEGPQMAGNYPGMASNFTEPAGIEHLDPIDEFADALLAQSIDRQKAGHPPGPNPLFNGRVGDGHFSAIGCEVWARAVGRRVVSLLEYRQAGRDAAKRARAAREAKPPPVNHPDTTTPR